MKPFSDLQKELTIDLPYPPVTLTKTTSVTRLLSRMLMPEKALKQLPSINIAYIVFISRISRKFMLPMKF